jgi:cytochrome b
MVNSFWYVLGKRSFERVGVHWLFHKIVRLLWGIMDDNRLQNWLRLLKR